VSKNLVQIESLIRRFWFMKKIMMFALAALVCASVAMAQTYTQGTGIQGIDKLGAHQNGGRGCVGCHTPHSGARGNGGAMQWNGTSFISVAPVGDVGNETLWGQDLEQIAGLGSIATGNAGEFPVDFTEMETRPRIKTGVVMCLSCHDGNVAKGAMMTNHSFEQAAGLLPNTYGWQPIPTLLGNDGGTAGNYQNDHPIGPEANISSLSIRSYLALDAAKARVVSNSAFAGSPYELFRTHYGLPTIIGARTGAGLAVETTMSSVDQAYVVCTTCHTPHSMYTASAGGTSNGAVPDGNPIAGSTSGTYPSYFFIAAPYNPAASVASGTKASSATQFCRQCHFTGAGGSNEGSNINTITTAF
jgi:cytochrome c553